MSDIKHILNKYKIENYEVYLDLLKSDHIDEYEITAVIYEKESSKIINGIEKLKILHRYKLDDNKNKILLILLDIIAQAWDEKELSIIEKCKELKRNCINNLSCSSEDLNEIGQFCKTIGKNYYRSDLKALFHKNLYCMSDDSSSSEDYSFSEDEQEDEDEDENENQDEQEIYSDSSDEDQSE